jgi:hypothetical protein
VNNTPTVSLTLEPGRNGELVYLAYDGNRPIIVMPASTEEHTLDWVRAWVKALLVEQGQP